MTALSDALAAAQAREEWEYLTGLRLLGREVSAYLDQHYPEPAYGIRYER